MHKRLLASATLGLGLCLLAAAPSSSNGTPGGSLASAAQGRPSPIQHVAIIYQENHTFDDVLGAVCQTRQTPCNGYTGPVTVSDGTTIENVVQPDIIPVVAHDPIAQRQGLRNRWNHVVGSSALYERFLLGGERPAHPWQDNPQRKDGGTACT